jgi:hypothetical protein
MAPHPAPPFIQRLTCDMELGFVAYNRRDALAFPEVKPALMQ